MRTFPDARVVAATPPGDIAAMGMPFARAEAIVAVAEAVASGSIDLQPGSDPDATRTKLAALRGVGRWTADYIAMRALRDADAFVAGDLVVQRALGVTTPRAAEERAKAWSPWRAYAVLHLWTMASEAPLERKRA